LVFATKYRHKVFTGEHLNRMEQIMRDVCADFETEPTEVRRVVAADAPRIPRTGRPLLPGEQAVVQVLLRRIGRRCAHLGAASLHRAAEPAR
jgi:hypothetical protein